MKIGIIGLPFVGKTSIFNALTRSTAEIGTFATHKKSNLGIVCVPDTRLDQLAEIFKPKKITHATIEYVDVAGVSKSETDHGGLETSVISDLRNVSAIAHVVRFFEDDSILHVDGEIDPRRDIETVEFELIFADLQIIENRLERIGKELRVKRDSDLERERDLLEKCRTALESGIGIRSLDLTSEDLKSINDFQFLTQKPLLIICNIGEDQLNQSDKILKNLDHLAENKNIEIITLSAKLEMEISQLDPEESAIFLKELGLSESALDRFVRASYRLLGLITFFTVVGKKEARAWTIRNGSIAVEAAGKIHTDLARGFIRSETINWRELVELGSFAKAKEKGLLRLEGKNYVVEDGDVLTIRFSV